jgi:hypothetical protein
MSPRKKINQTLANHILAVYKSMEEDAQDIGGQLAFVGRLSEVTMGLGISSTYYSKIFRALYEGGYAVLEDRGGRDKPSTIFLLREPTRDELLGLTSIDSDPILSNMKRLEAIENSLGGLYVAGALKELERRVAILEEAERAHGKTEA